MRKLWVLAVALVALVLSSARADEILLRNGGRLTGRVVSETEREVVLLLDDGMKMRLSRDLIEEIVRREEPGAPDGGADEPPAEEEPEPPEEAPEPDPTPAPPPTATVAGPDIFAGDARAAWERRFASYPELTASRVVRFRAYEHVRHEPLGVAPDDERFADLARKHGHGGSVSRWWFRYDGNREFRFGDLVKFVAEITVPAGAGANLVHLDQGPQPTAERLAVFLVRRDNRFWRYASPTTFDSRDFRAADLRALDTKVVPVRTYCPDFSHLATTWLVPSESEFLAGLTSPFGDSVRVQLDRLRYRLRWFEMPVSERPGLDPDLLAKNVVRPVAAPGRPHATEQDIRKYWGNEGLTRRKLVMLRAEVRSMLAGIGAGPEGSFYVERDVVGTFGKKGITLETQRYRLDEATLGEVLGD